MQPAEWNIKRALPRQYIPFYAINNYLIFKAKNKPCAIILIGEKPTK